MTAITLKEVDESTDRVFTSMGETPEKQSLFMDLADTAGLGLQRQLRFGFLMPKDLSAGRVKLTTNIVVPKLNSATGIVEFGTYGSTVYYPVSWNAADRKELEILHEYLAINAAYKSFLRDLDRPD